jgi:hypothetical protein
MSAICWWFGRLTKTLHLKRRVFGVRLIIISDGTEASAAGRSARARVARESKLGTSLRGGPTIISGAKIGYIPTEPPCLA